RRAPGRRPLMAGPLDADVIVVGLGVHGSAAVAALARRGHRVIGLERFSSGHARGSSHGRTRMIRRAYPNAVWNDLVAGADRAWERLERETGAILIHRTGGLYAHRGAAQLQGPDCVPLEGAGDLARRMPGFRVPEGYSAIYDPAAGVLEAERAIDALRRVARNAGAQLRFAQRVRDWQVEDDAVHVRLDDAVLRARRLVVAVGPWAATAIPALAPLLEVWRILTLTVAAGQTVAMPPQLGAFSVDRPEGLVFGIPDADGNGFKLGVDAGMPWDPESAPAAPTGDEIDRLRTLMQTYVPGIDTSRADAAACLYTMTADKRFILGPLAATPEVIVASACSGHGFKFGAVIGEALADMCEGDPRGDLEFVSTARRGL
ncbi:MAG: N-methyl-L-tryptophan oxidase, partial [Microbacterium sp.]